MIQRVKAWGKNYFEKTHLDLVIVGRNGYNALRIYHWNHFTIYAIGMAMLKTFSPMS